MQAKTISGKSTFEIRASLEQILMEARQPNRPGSEEDETIGRAFKPTLAVVFMSIKQDREAICSLLDGYGIQIFGSTTSGEFISGEISEGGITILLLDMDPTSFEIVFLEAGTRPVYEMAKEMGARGKSRFSRPAYIIVSGWVNMDGDEIIKGIEDGFGGVPTIFGGMAGDDLTLAGPIVFTNDRSDIAGLAAILIDEDRVRVEGISTCGWKPVGTTKTVTKSTGNIIYTIDDQPAFDLVIKYLGLNEDDMATVTGSIVNFESNYPLQLEREDAAPVMRTAQLGNLVDRSLLCSGNVPQGAKFRFSLPLDFDVIDTVVRECSDLKNRGDGDADAVIMFSCVSRYYSLGMMAGEEINKVMKIWNVPFIGFFTYGEFGISLSGGHEKNRESGKRKKHEFHNNTCCVVVLKEKSQE